MSRTPVDVLFAIPELDRGGPDRVLFELLSAINRERFRPSVMVEAADGYYLSRLSSDIPIHRLGRGRIGSRYPVLSALRHIRAKRPDVVFAMQRMILTLGAVRLAFPRPTRFVVRQANDLTADFAMLTRQSVLKHRIARALIISTLKRADAVVCQSKAMRADLARSMGDASHLHVINNPIDVEAALRVSEKTVNLAGHPKLVSVGRLMPQKGFDILIAAVATIKDAFPTLHLTIIGDGPDRARLVADAARLGVANQITFAGFSADPLPLVRAADLFVLASRYEGFPNAALESLAVGTPIVLTDCPGANAEIVEPGRNGRLAPTVDAKSVAAALVAALAELKSYDRREISEDCDRRFATQRIVRAYEAVIGSVDDSTA